MRVVSLRHQEWIEPHPVGPWERSTHQHCVCPARPLLISASRSAVVPLQQHQTAHDGDVATRPRPPTGEAVTEAAEALRRLLVAFEEGELTVTTPQEVALVRRLQGALTALEAVAGQPG